jgi:signal transduction histidine kinase/ActR/RegA family two-component response regulator
MMTARGATEVQALRRTPGHTRVTLSSSAERLGAAALLEYSRALQGARDYHTLVAVTLPAVQTSLGYNTVWLYVVERPESYFAKLVGIAGASRSAVWDTSAVLDMADDPFLKEIREADHAVVVNDAASDPRTNKAFVEALQLRTVINVPLLLVDGYLGVLGTGSFGAEGLKPPTPAELDHLTALASHLSVALARIRLDEQQVSAAREKAELERKLLGAQRLESIGLLAGGVAHDFNNLLVVMLGNAELLGRGPLTDAQRTDLDAITNAATRAAHLTRQLLSMSRQQRQSVAPVDLNVALREVAKLLQRLLPETLRLEVREQPGLPSVDGDRGQLEQVVMNLCLNARDAMPKGGVLGLTVAAESVGADFVATHRWAREGRFVVVRIQDSGAGMTPEVLERIFDPFFTTKAPGRGTGLGLAVVHGIVAGHGGFVHCDSTPGVGTTFAVYLPAAGPSTVAPPARPTEVVRGGDERVLVADDQPEVREVLRRTLRDAGYRTTAVADGLEAVSAAQVEPFDLILLDVVMPGMSSREVRDRIQALRPGARFLFVSGHPSELLPADLLAEPGVSLLEKPFGAGRLLVAVRQALGSLARAATGDRPE